MLSISLLVLFTYYCCLASFIRVVGSEFVQKYLGEGPRMVRDVFRLARENSPAIIFIDEIDAIATKRFDAQTGGVLATTIAILLHMHQHYQVMLHRDTKNHTSLVLSVSE